MNTLIVDQQIAESLPARCKSVLIGLANSENPKSLGGLLGISPKTVEYHRATVMRKLRINDLAGLTRFAIRSGLIQA
jgi:FixJ family two-component response regulator